MKLDQKQVAFQLQNFMQSLLFKNMNLLINQEHYQNNNANIINLYYILLRNFMENIYNQLLSRQVVRNVRNHTKISQQSKQPVNYGDWILFEKNQQYSLASHSFTTSRIHCIAFQKHNMIKNCYFQIRLLKTISKQDCEYYQDITHTQTVFNRCVHAQNKIALLHIETNMYLCALTQGNNQISHIILKPQLTNECIFFFEQQKNPEEDHSFTNLSVVNLVHNMSKMYIKLTPSENISTYFFIIDDNFSASLSKNKDSFVLRLVRKIDPSLQIYLNNEDLVMLKNNNQTTTLILKQKEDFLCSSYNLTNQIILNNQYFSLNNNYLYNAPVEDQAENILNLLWEIKKTTYKISDSDTNYLIRKKESVVIKHVKTGLYLCKDIKGGLSLTNDRNNPEASFKLTNSKTYQFQRKSMNSAPIYLNDTIQIDGVGNKFIFVKKNNTSFVRIVNQNLIKFFEYLLEYFEGDDSNQEEIKTLQKKYRYVYDMFSKNFQNTTDRGEYLFQISLVFLQILNAKVDTKIVRFVLPKARLLKQFLESLMKFLQIFTSKEPYLRYSNSTKKYLISLVVGLFGKIDYLNLQPLVANIAQAQCGLCISQLTSKTKILNSNLSSRSDLMLRLKTIRVINKICQRYRLKFYYIPDILKKICQNVSISIENGVIIIAEGKFTLQLLDETSFAQTQEYNNSRSAYFMELMKLCYYQNTIHEDILVRIIFILREMIGEYNNILFLNTLLEIFNNFYLQRSYLPFIQNIKFVFIDGWLQPATELSFILTDGGFSDFLISQTLMKLIRKIQQGIWEKLKIQDRLKYLSSIIYTIGLFIAYGELTLEIFKQLEIFLIKILLVLSDHIEYHSTNQQIKFQPQLKTLSSELKQFFSMPYEDQISSQLMQTICILIDALNTSFKVIKCQKFRLLSYPLINNRQKLFQLNFFKEVYHSLQFYVFIDTNFPIIQQIAEMYKNNHTLTRTRQSLSYFWSEDRLIYHEKLVVMKQILIQMHKIKRINQTLFKFDHQKKITEDLISDIKQGVIEISTHLLENSSKQLKSFSELCIRGLSLPQSMYEIIFNSQNLEEEFSVQLLNFLYHYPPKFHTLLQQIYHSPTTFIKITAKSLQLNQSQILLEDVIKLVELSQKKLKDQQLIYFLGVLHEFWNGNQKLNLFFYEKLISMQVVYDFLQASRTLKSLKLYWNQIEKDNSFKHICDKYSISLILIFWLSMRNPTCHRHIRNYFRWEQIFRIIEDEQVPHVVKSVFVAYLHTDTKVFKDITIFDRYLIFIKSMLSQNDKYTKNLQYYDSSNFLLKGQNAHAQKGQFLSLEELARFDWRKVDYWQSLYFRPFYRQEQGIIPFLEYLMINMPTSFRAYCSQNTITGIHSQLTSIRSLLKHQTKGNDDLIVKITKIVFLIQESFPHIKVDKSEFPEFRMRHIVIDRIVNFLFNNGRLQSFVREFDIKNQEVMSDSSGKSIEHISANSSSMLEQSDSSHEMTRHALINPMPKTPQQYSINKGRLYTLKLSQILQKIYNIFKQKKQNLLPQKQQQSCQFVLKCSKNKQQIILERMMVAYYQIGGAISDILSATHDRISSLRSKAVARKYLSRYSFQRKLQYSDDVRIYEISNVRTDSQECLNSFIIEKKLMKKQNLLLEQINERSQIECEKFSDLLYFIKRKKIMILFHVLKTFKAENFCSFSIDEVSLLFNLLLTNKQDTFELINEEAKICYIKSIKMLLKNLMNSKSPQQQKLLASIQSQRVIFEFLYKMSLDQLKPELVQEIIDIYLLYEQSTSQYHLHIYEIVQEKFLKKMKLHSRQLLCSMSKILAYFIKCSQRCFDDCQSKLRMEQFMNSELVKNFLINTLNKTIYQSLDSENFIAQERIKVVLQIYDLLLLQVLEVPIQTTKRYLKGQLLQLLVQMEINLYLRVYSQQFSITKKYLTQDRFDSLNNIIIQSLNIFHNIKFMSNSAVQGLSILKQQRINLLCLEDQKSEKFKSKLQLLNWSQAYHFYENRFHFIIIVKNHKQVVSVFPKQQNVSGKWKLLLLGQMNKEKSLTAKKQFVFKITQYVMNKQEQNREQVLASFLQQSKRIVLGISVMIISLLTLLCFLYDGMNESPVASVKIVLLSLNLPFVLFLILEKIVYFITVSKMTFQTNQSSLQQPHTTEDKLTFFLKISKNFIGIIMGLALLGLNIGSYLRSEIIPALYLVIPFYFWGSTDYFMQLFLKRGSAILQISVIFFLILLLFQLMSRVSSYQSMSQVNFHPFYNNQRGEFYYNNYLSLLFAEWKQQYNKYPQTIIFSFVGAFYYFFILGFMVFHSIDHESKSSQQHSVCYLCPDRVSVVKVDFLKHVQYEHNVFKYAFFFKYILKKKEKELTSTERSIKQLITAKNHHLFLK